MDCINAIEQLNKWLLILNEPALTRTEQALISQQFEECYEDICQIFNILILILERRARDGSCYNIPTAGLEDLAQFLGCPYDPSDDDSGQSYIIGVGSGNNGCCGGCCGF